eukprot:3469548-Prymnesium_polylepis.1
MSRAAALGRRVRSGAPFATPHAHICGIFATRPAARAEGPSVSPWACKVRRGQTGDCYKRSLHREAEHGALPYGEGTAGAAAGGHTEGAGGEARRAGEANGRAKAAARRAAEAAHGAEAEQLAEQAAALKQQLAERDKKATEQAAELEKNMAEMKKQLEEAATELAKLRSPVKAPAAAAPVPATPKSQAVLDIEAEAAREEKGSTAASTFSTSPKFNKFEGDTMPNFQELGEKYPKMLVEGTI